MGNQAGSSNGAASKFKQKNPSGDIPEPDPFGPGSTFARRLSMTRSRKNSDLSSSGAKSDILPHSNKQPSPRNSGGAKHRRNVSDSLAGLDKSGSTTLSAPSLGGSDRGLLCKSSVSPTAFSRKQKADASFQATDTSQVSLTLTTSNLSAGRDDIGGRDSDSEISLAPDGIMTLDTTDLPQSPDSASLTMRQSQKERHDLREASEVLPWLFLGGVEVAKSKRYLRSLGISHVLNCAHTVCENYHEDEFKYVRAMDLADAADEEIGNFMLQAIADIETVRETGGRILVHCQKGSSRSATLVIAYLMWYQNIDVEKAFSFVKKKRSIVSPNFGFMVQLRDFRKRLDWRPTQATLHRVAPHSSTDDTLVVKLIVRADGSHEPVVPRVEHLDPRGTFLLHSPADRTMYLWVGPDVGLQAEEDAQARKQARAERVSSSINVLNSAKRKSENKVRETYEQAGRRMGRIMCKIERAFRDDVGNPCLFVIVPNNEHAISALAEGANPNSLAAKFWKTLGERIGSRKGLESMRAGRNRRWSEEDDKGVVAYVDKASSRVFEMTNVAVGRAGVESITSDDGDASSNRSLVEGGG